MGGLKKDLPITYWTFVVGAIAIAGVPPFAGFFSKDEILFRTFASGHTLLWAVGLLTALLTAAYMFRLVFMTFHGHARRPRQPTTTMRTSIMGMTTTPICTTRRPRWRSRSSCWPSDR